MITNNSFKFKGGSAYYASTKFINSVEQVSSEIDEFIRQENAYYNSMYEEMAAEWHKEHYIDRDVKEGLVCLV